MNQWTNLSESPGNRMKNSSQWIIEQTLFFQSAAFWRNSDTLNIHWIVLKSCKKKSDFVQIGHNSVNLYFMRYLYIHTFLSVEEKGQASMKCIWEVNIERRDCNGTI